MIRDTGWGAYGSLDESYKDDQLAATQALLSTASELLEQVYAQGVSEPLCAKIKEFLKK